MKRHKQNMEAYEIYGKNVVEIRVVLLPLNIFFFASYKNHLRISL